MRRFPNGGDAGHWERLLREQEWERKLLRRLMGMTAAGIGTGFVVVGTGCMATGAAGCGLIIADDLTVVGVADAPLLVLTGGVVLVGGGMVLVGWGIGAACAP
jgi:hypothetical protein